jgi:hypothetical protein
MEKLNTDISDISIRAIQSGMILADDIFSKKNALLIRKGIIVTPALLERILNIEAQVGIQQPIRVSIPKYFKWITEKNVKNN